MSLIYFLDLEADCFTKEIHEKIENYIFIIKNAYFWTQKMQEVLNLALSD